MQDAVYLLIEVGAFLLFNRLVVVAHHGVAGIREELAQDMKVNRIVVLCFVHHHLPNIRELVAAKQAQMQVEHRHGILIGDDAGGL